MVVGEASIHNIMGGMESTGGVRLHNHKRKLKQRFDIIKKLGQGTYGKVQLGINKETGQEVAIKTIKKCKIETEADLIRIRREIQIMSSVQHPNIIHIYEVFENKEKMVLVMEYAAGGELYDYLSERKVLSEQEARRIFRQISIAVFYCHKHKICHRDLKLENILLDQIGNAKIADFGLSNVFDEQRLLNTFCGSPLYASPEIVKGTPYHGPEVDCWSLGVLLYTLVYGAMPFDGSNFKRLTRQISQSDYFEPTTPSPASPLIKDMLTKCPSRRSDIEKICSHWWVNEGYEQNCLDIAEDLAAQTPVRLDLLLSLVPQSASADKLVVGDQRAAGEVVNNVSSETVAPTRCHSVGSLMELDRNNSERRVREMVEEDARGSTLGDSKRKLENTPSMDEAAGLCEAGAKRKERLRKKDKNVDARPHRFTSNRHHSAPIAHPITEEAMEIDVSEATASKPLLDLRNDETASACLELIKESLSKSPSKERSKTPVSMPDKDTTMSLENVRDVNENVNDAKPMSNKLAVLEDKPAPPQLSRSELPEKVWKEVRNENEISAKREIEMNDKIVDAVSKVPNSEKEIQDAAKASKVENDKVPISREIEQVESPSRADVKKLKEKAPSLDSDSGNEVALPPAKPTERRRSKIFETAEKFNQLAAGVENEKPKKIFIPGVNVGGAKRVFERKASLSSIVVPQTVKQSASKVLIDMPREKRSDKVEEKTDLVESSPEVKDDNLRKEEEKKRAIDIITGAIGKPPVQKKINGSPPPITPQSPESKKLGLKIQVGPNDMRTATVSVTTPVDTKFPFETKLAPYETSVPNSPESQSLDSSYTDEPTMSSKMEITLKSATLPRQRKTSKAEITLSEIKSAEPGAFKAEVEAKIDAFHPQKLRTQRSEVAFPVVARSISHANRSSSLEPESAANIAPKERIIPIQVETGYEHQRQTATPPPKPPVPQRSMSQRSGSLSRQSTADSDTDSALGSTIGPEPIRKSPREYIIPIAVEGGGYVTPRSGSVEPESKNSTPTSTNPPRSRFGRPRRMSSLLSDASEDESPFSTLHRDSDDLLQRHMHRLRSSRPTRQPPEHADSLSSGEDDDDDGFELLTAENLFSTLLSRVRSLTQRLNVDDNRSSGFPSSRLLGRLGSNASQGFWGLHEPLSRRLSESQFRRSMSRDTDRFGKRDTATSSGTPNSPGARNTPSRESIFEMGSSNTLPRDRKTREEDTSDAPKLRKQNSQDSLEQNFTPSLARRLSRQFIEQTRQSLPRSPSIPREKLYGSSSLERNEDNENRQYSSTISDRSEYRRSRSCDRGASGIRRDNALLENNDRIEKMEHRSPRRSVSLFDDEDDSSISSITSMPRQVMTLGRKYREPIKSGGLPSFHNYRTEKIQEEPQDELAYSMKNINGGIHSNQRRKESSPSTNESNINLGDTASSLSARSCETSPTESSSTLGDCTLSSYKQDCSRDFENRLLATENMIKESKLRNLGSGKYDPNLSSSYKETDKCDKELLSSMAELNGNSGGGTISKRRTCIPSLRLRSGSLTREASTSFADRRSTLSCTKEEPNGGDENRGCTPERSILSKFFRAGSSSGSSKGEQETKEKSPKAKGPRRISRFLRPDFFDTPREESRYVKEKEARKAADNERRKSRFMKKKNELSNVTTTLTSGEDEENIENSNEKPEKELKNEANAITRDKTELFPRDNKIEESTVFEPNENTPKIERQSSKNSFLQSLEKKLEKFRSSDDGSKLLSNGNRSTNGCRRERPLRENSAPPIETSDGTSGLTKRSTSVENLTPTEDSSAGTPPRRRVSSVLGLFKNDSSKLSTNRNSQRTQSTILSKFKRNAYKGSRSDSILSTDQLPSTSGSNGNGGSSSSNGNSSSSKIPTKFAKIETKTKKIVDGKKSGDEKTPEAKNNSPSKEKSPIERILLSRKSLEKQTKAAANKSSPERSNEGKLDKPEKTTSSKEDERKNTSPDKIDEGTSVVSRLGTKKSSPDKVTDNKQTEGKTSEVDKDKKIIVKAKKNLTTSTDLVKNRSVSKVEKTEGGEKRVKKVVKAKENSEKDGVDGTKKKKIVRVVKKVAKNSDSSESKSEEKEVAAKKKTLIKKITSGTTKKDSSPENAAKKFNSEKTPEDTQQRKDEDKTPDDTRRSSTGSSSNNSPPDDTKGSSQTLTKFDPKPTISIPDDPPITAELSTQPTDLKIPKELESRANRSIPNNVRTPCDSSSKNLPPGLGTSKSNKVNLKLDLSKIPQHAFKTGPSLKKDPTKETSNGKSNIRKVISSNEVRKSEELGSKSMGVERDSAIFHREIYDPEMTKSSKIDPRPGQLDNFQEASEIGKQVRRKSIGNEVVVVVDAFVDEPSTKTRDVSQDHRVEDIFSSLNDEDEEDDGVATAISDTNANANAESFDSWSMCSTDTNHRRDLNSPTSPTYSLSSRGDHPESIVDRIRRKSFYSRFNERKRKSSLNVTSPVGTTLPSCSTLTRKFSFNSSRDKDYRKPSCTYSASTSSRRQPERSYSLYNEGAVVTALPTYRKSSQERDRHYSDSDRYNSATGGGGLNSCYDSLRRYRISPSTSDSLTSRRKYRSTDYGLDDEIGSYKSPISPSSFLDESPLESYGSRSTMPRKYRSVSSCPETKSVDYYEELLAPSRSDYLTSRKTPIPSNDYHPRHENGYHNENLDLRHVENDKWKTYSDKIAGLDLTDGSDGRLDNQTRSNAERDHESRNLPASSTEPDGKTSKVD